MALERGTQCEGTAVADPAGDRTHGFLGALVFLTLSALLAWRGEGRPALPWILCGLVLYVVVLVVTGVVNVPLNNQLAAAGNPDGIADLATVRAHFESTWVSGNVVRALANTAAFGCLTWALIVHGRTGG